nr:hypothetical protein Iba_chr02bCG21880 [Ipomoea batatas]GMC61636.1 hypothetical protein Iba_chr02bCG21900 [Ipomoea batatas]
MESAEAGASLSENVTSLLATWFTVSTKFVGLFSNTLPCFGNLESLASVGDLSLMAKRFDSDGFSFGESLSICSNIFAAVSLDLVVGRTLEYGVRAMLYTADLPRDFGVVKPFSVTPKIPGLLANDAIGDCETNGTTSLTV